MRKHDALQLALVWVLLSGMPGLVLGSKSLRQQRPPNILFIMTDDQGAWTPSFTGHKGAITPHLDQMRKDGMAFGNMLTTTPVCSPSRGVLMASRYSSELGIPDWINGSNGLEPEFIAWPKILQQAGYRTGLIGKWHLGHLHERHHPRSHGYDYFMGFLNGGTSPMSPKLEKEGKLQPTEGLLVQTLTEDAIAFIKRNRERPFCLSLHYRAPHLRFKPVSTEASTLHRGIEYYVPQGHPDLDLSRAQSYMKDYCTIISDIDINLGHLLKKVDEFGLRGKTIVFFTSDHGYNAGHHGLQGKGNGGWMTRSYTDSDQWPNIVGKKRPNMFDTSLRVPFVVRWPNVIKPGSQCKQTIDFLDLYPTLCALAGARIPPEVKIHGKDFSRLLTNPNADWSNESYSEYDLKEARTKTHMRCWRTPKWKLIVDFKNRDRWELYDLMNDPGETRNLKGSDDPAALAATTELYAKIIARMTALQDPVLSQVQGWESVSSFKRNKAKP
jgi:choline-sulfatase